MNNELYCKKMCKILFFSAFVGLIIEFIAII